MPNDRTQYQSSDEIKSARDLSLSPKVPPSQVPGYAIESLLGSGAYGEVWLATDRKTGRRVAIKFYTRHGAVDLSLLSREVEKLVFLSADRYVVQLLDVGWDSKPPYYVMDFIEKGSLEDELARRGTLPINEALDMIEEIGIGLMHLHGKGILHCDLKPGNVLLDQDDKPRLADFGQSRLSHEQAPALGTLFFMAPEQADLRAAPDAKWDVYALGAILYCMLTGEPPFRDAELIQKIESSDGLEDRLEQYRLLIESAPKPVGHRRIPGVDRALTEMIDRAIARNPRHRFDSVQSVLQALGLRKQAHARRPLVILGLVGPLVLLAVISLIGWNAYRGAIAETEKSITVQTLETNHWIAQVAARSASEQIDHFFRVLQDLTDNPEIQFRLAMVIDDPQVKEMLNQLSNPDDNSNIGLNSVRNRLIASPVRKKLQAPLEANLSNPGYPKAASWFFCDPAGTQIASAFTSEKPSNTIGKNYSYRSYFTGQSESASTKSPTDEISDSNKNSNLREHVSGPYLSDVFQSKATNAWKVAFSSPVYHEGRFVGIAAVTADLGSLVEFQNADDQYVMLVDSRPGDYQGIVLEHPLLREKQREAERQGTPLPPGLSTRRVGADALKTMENADIGLDDFHDPIADDPAGTAYDRDWIASWADVFYKANLAGYATQTELRSVTGLKVIAVADREVAMLPSRTLGQQLAQMGSLALLVFLFVSGGLLYFVFRSLRLGRERIARMSGSTSESIGSSVRDAETIMAGQ